MKSTQDKFRLVNDGKMLKKDFLTEVKRSHSNLITQTTTYKDAVQILKNKNILISCGATFEKIDDARAITNLSSGKMGFSIVNEAYALGANVTLISGPTNLQPPPKVKLIKVITAQEMDKAVKKNSKADIAVFAAAVSDVAPQKKTYKKIKKEKQKKII